MPPFIEFLGHRKYSGVTVMQAFNPVGTAVLTHTARVKGNPKHVMDEDGYQSYINRYNGKAQVYVGLNPIKPDTKGFPTDKDVLVWCNELLDLDLEKPKLIDEDVPDGYPKECKHYAAREDDLNKLKPFIDKINGWLTDHGFKTGYQDHTGNGYRWILPVPGLDLIGHDLEALAARKKEFKEQIARECGIIDGCGVHLDSVFDFRRITGTPGTLNFKLETETRNNRIREPFRGTERDEDQALRDHILHIDVSKPEPHPTKQGAGVGALKHRMVHDVKLKRLYEGDTTGYESRSDAEMTLANKLVFYNFSESEIEDTLLSAGIGKAAEEKKRGHTKYIERTIRKAFEFVVERVQEPTTKRMDRLAFRTDHLRNYRELDHAVALEGTDFTPFVKALWYNIIGAIKTQPVRFGNITTDTRFNLFIPMPSGTGKNNLKQAIRKIVTGCGKKLSAPTSFHPEQLIGKMMTERFYNPEKEGKKDVPNDTRHVPNYGYLKEGVVVFDEAYHFVTRDDKQYDESKTYIRIALDPIGNNLIQKKLVDQFDVPEQRMEYYPHCSIVMFLQPDGMDDSNVKTGFLRRFGVVYVPLVGKNLDRKEEFIRHIMNVRPEVSFDYWQDLERWNRWVGNDDGRVDFKFEEGINDLLIVLHDDLITYMRTLGEKQRNYLDRKTYALFDDLVGMAAIQAISRKSDTVTHQDVKLAYMDLFEFFKLSLDFINAKVFGNLDYGEKWHGAEAKEIGALKWLANRGATDKDKSEVTIAAFKAHIAEIFEIGEEAARKHHQKLKKRGLIDSKQIGKDSSRVWVTFDPEDAADTAPMALDQTLYWKIAQDETTDTPDTTLPPLPPLPPDSDLRVVKQIPPLSPIAKDDLPPLNDSGLDGEVKGGKTETNNERRGGKCDTTLKPIASDKGGKGGRVVSGVSVENPIKLAQDDRMKSIDRFFRDRGITCKSSEELTEFVSEITEALKISQDVAFRSVMQYGHDRGWL